MVNMNACVCLAGWYFQQELLDALCSTTGIQLYIISHQPPQAVQKGIFQTLPENHLFFERNIGYDWGAYQQFTAKDIWKNFETVFFMHDDLTLLDTAIFSICHDTIHTHNGAVVIGNGRNSSKRDWPHTHIQSYAHSLWKPPAWSFEHDTVRGSFFALSSSVLEQIQHFEVLWDRKKLYGVGAGNHSLRATCGKIQSILGGEPFNFLSETYRQSSYLIELERGQESLSRKQVSLAWKGINKGLVFFSRMLMNQYMDADLGKKQKLAKFMQWIYGKI
jgi:hypothetical protein